MIKKRSPTMRFRGKRARNLVWGNSLHEAER
jgi:hypothetical protein